MAVTEPGNLADLNHDGSTETTAITNAMAGQKGYPMHTVDGGVIKVVRKAQGVGGITAFFDAAGNEYRPASGHYGKLELVQASDEPQDPVMPVGESNTGPDQQPTEAQVEAAFGPEGPPAEPGAEPAQDAEPSTEPEEGQDSPE